MSQSPLPALGIATLVGLALGIFFRRVHVMLLLILPALLAMGIIVAVEILIGQIAQDLGHEVLYVLLGVFATVFPLAAGVALAAGPIARAVDDRIKGNPIRLRHACAVLVERPASLILSAFVIIQGCLAVAIGAALLGSPLYGIITILPGLIAPFYVLGRWGIAVPAIALEGAGFNALRRASALSRGYRWSSAGYFFVLGFVGFLLSAVPGVLMGMFVFGSISGIESGGAASEIWIGLLYGLIWAFSLVAALGLSSVAAAVLYVRLVEIKEGGDIGDVIEVFE